jgi:putative membrane protein
VLLWSGWRPHDVATWALEVSPAVIAAALLAATRRRFPLTPLAYGLILAHAIVLMIGGHYTYARVPAGDWFADAFGLARNHYDRLGHLFQGFVPALVVRELLLRATPLRPGAWLTGLVFWVCLGFGAFYELIEWWVALLSEEAAESFLGTQGDVWDTQWDLFLCGVGATLSLLALARIHDRALGLARARA